MRRKTMIKMNSKVKNDLRSFVSKVKKKIKLKCMILFGSRARGDFSPFSDVDLIIIGDFKEEFLNSPYDGEIAYMDYYVGKTIEKLREKDILDKTLVILVGDHGEALGEKEVAGHGVFLYDVTMKAPLIFYAENHRFFPSIRRVQRS